MDYNPGMLFSELAKYFEKLEETSSRLALIDILADLFKQVKVTEVGHVSYLIQGRIAPFFEPLEIGMAEKNVAAAIAKAYGVERAEVLKEYGKVGDLGKVAEKLKAASKVLIKDNDSKLTVSEVFNTLRGIAQMSGEGTVEKKVNTLVELLERVDGVGAKHLVRIPLGTSRLGIGDPTVLDAFALSKLGDRKQKSLLEATYNKTSDLGLIGETLWRDGLAGIQKLDVTLGRPIRSQLAER